MTVCLAALSMSGSTIVCLADKALSYGDVSWDSDAAKIIPLGPKKARQAVALTAGSERYITRFLNKIETYNGYSGSAGDIRVYLETQYRDCVREMQDIEILLPHALTREEFVSAISGGNTNDLIKSIDQEMAKFSVEGFDCEILVCGFQNMAAPYIFLLRAPGLIIDCTNTGFHAIGEGAERAMSRLLLVEHKRTHGVTNTLFDCFEAKVAAEMTVSVGTKWDAYLVNGPNIKPIVQEAKPLLDKVWAERNRSPFKTEKDPDELDPPPQDWQEQLRGMVAKSLGVSVETNAWTMPEDS